MLRKTLLALAAATAMTGPVFAADIIEPIPVEPLPVPVATSGWYLRGDVGYVFDSHNEGRWDFYNIGIYNSDTGGYDYRGVDDTFHYGDFDLKDSVIAGGGVGYRFNEYFRMDATADWFSPDLDGNRQCPHYVAASQFGQAAPDIACKYNDKADLDVITVMANAYVDLGTYSIFTPYVGGGLGTAYVDYGNLTVEQCGFRCGDPDNIFFENEGKDSWRFAGALMAGVTTDITPNLKLDVGYRYTYVDDGKAFSYDGADKAAGATGTQIRDDGFNFHAVRAGLRYEFF